MKKSRKIISLILCMTGMSLLFILNVPSVSGNDYSFYVSSMETNISIISDENAMVRWFTNPNVMLKVIDIFIIICKIGLFVGIAYIVVRFLIITRKKYYPPEVHDGKMRSYVLIGIIAAGYAWLIVSDTWNQFGSIYSVVGTFIMLILGFAMFGYLLYRIIIRYKAPYCKPELLVDCAGVKKGLSVVEVAIIRNTPLKKVVFLIAFGLIKSGHLKIKNLDPLEFRVLSRKNLQSLKWYHRRFINVITPIRSGHPVDQEKLRALLIDLIRKTHLRMKGYDLEATNLYYENCVNRAWESVKKLPKGDVDWKDLEKNYEWMMIDELFEERSRRYFSHTYCSKKPIWKKNYPYYNHRHQINNVVSGAVRVNPNAQIERLNIHSLSDSIVRGMENMSNKLVNNFSTFADKIVDKVRPIIRPPSTRVPGGSSYHGGGCACACAGCACACAGGGR